MNLTAIIPVGQREIIVNGLHQWDYGQKLEIRSNTLPAIIEIHFACSGMQEAVVRNCDVVDGVAVADIPDICIEQTTPIVAWVYTINNSSGRTECTIIMPVIARAKPAPIASIPTVITNRYTELITSVNTAIAKLETGATVVSRAATADSATTAETANLATKATNADNADLATKATRDGAGNVIVDTYLPKKAKAKEAESADYAISSVSAETADYLTYSYTAECDIDKGTGTVPANLKKGELYLVILKIESSGLYRFFSGILYYANPTSEGAKESATTLGSHVLNINSTIGITFTSTSGGFEEITGTLKFYSLGKEEVTT